MIITYGDIERFVDQGDLDLAESHLTTMAALVKGWTRGNGFAPGPYNIIDVEEDLAAVIITACARLVANPSQFRREEISGYSVVGGFDGFTLPEQLILNRYRKRAA